MFNWLRRNRYLLFSGVYYYPNGGWLDFTSAHRTIEEARAAHYKSVEDEKAAHERWLNDKNEPYASVEEYWAQVVDSSTLKIVWEDYKT